MSLDLNAAVIVALGSNLAGRFETSASVIGAALATLAERGIKPVASSSLWRSAAWPDPNDPAYLNAVAIVETTLTSRALLEALHAIERAFGARSQARNAPRVLDLDLVAHGREVLTDGDLRLPHPRAAERRFVMGPLAEIAPNWVHPVLGRRAAELVDNASVGRDAAPFVRIQRDGLGGDLAASAGSPASGA